MLIYHVLTSLETMNMSWSLPTLRDLIFTAPIGIGICIVLGFFWNLPAIFRSMYGIFFRSYNTCLEYAACLPNAIRSFWQFIRKPRGNSTPLADSNSGQATAAFPTWLSAQTRYIFKLRTHTTIFGIIPKLEQDLTCPLCLEIFTDPILLEQCLHRFCQNCWDAYWCNYVKPVRGQNGPTYTNRYGKIQRYNYYLPCPVCQKTTCIHHDGEVYARTGYQQDRLVREMADKAKALRAQRLSWFKSFGDLRRTGASPSKESSNHSTTNTEPRPIGQGEQAGQ